MFSRKKLKTNLQQGEGHSELIENKQLSSIIVVWLATQTSVTSDDACDSYFKH